MWGRYRVCFPQDQQYVMLDLETTGLKASRHYIIEVAALRMNPERSDAPYYHRLLRPKGRISPRIKELTGITDELLDRDGMDRRQVFEGLVDFIGKDPVASYNAPFDLSFLSAAYAAHGLKPERAAGHSCALALTRRTWPGLSSYRLSAVAARFGLDLSGDHRALGDALRAAQIYRIANMYRLASAGNVAAIQALRELTERLEQKLSRQREGIEPGIADETSATN